MRTRSPSTRAFEWSSRSGPAWLNLKPATGRGHGTDRGAPFSRPIGLGSPERQLSTVSACAPALSSIGSSRPIAEGGQAGEHPVDRRGLLGPHCQRVAAALAHGDWGEAIGGKTSAAGLGKRLAEQAHVAGAVRDGVGALAGGREVGPETVKSVLHSRIWGRTYPHIGISQGGTSVAPWRSARVRSAPRRST